MYKLPEQSVKDNDRIRVERYDNTLLFYHALTNNLICKHQMPNGIGNVVSLPENMKTVSIEEELKLYYKNDKIALAFLQKMRQQKPRYVYPQCDRLRRMQKYYTDEQIHSGMVHCIDINVCTLMELSSYLLYRYGEDVVREYLNHNSYKHYKARSLEIKEEEQHGRHI